jgi:hypothetical protein
MTAIPAAVRGAGLAIAVLVGLGSMGWLVQSHLVEDVDRGMPGVEPAVPERFAIEDLGEVDPRAAYSALLGVADEAALLGAADEAAGVRFVEGGAEVTLLFDPAEDLLDERRISAGGTAVRTFWRGRVVERLRWGAEHGTLDLPGAPGPDRRNLYH